MADRADRSGRKRLAATLVAIGISLVVGASVLGALGAGFATGWSPHSGATGVSTARLGNSTGASVHSSAWGISAGPKTTTGAFNVAAGSDVFVFVGYINARIGGGTISKITDSSGNVYRLLSTTGFADNHTQTLFMAKNVAAASALKVSVTFSGGATTQGGSVAAIDVTGQAGIPIDVKGTSHGAKDIGSVALDTGTSGDLFLVGVSGQAKIANVTAGNGEILLNTAGADAGPFTDGEGFGTMYTSGETGLFGLAFGLQNSAAWAAIAVGIR
jgi:hypothetical protein